MEDCDKTEDLLFLLGLATKKVQAGMKVENSINHSMTIQS
jgi:hypothetical protein